MQTVTPRGRNGLDEKGRGAERRDLMLCNEFETRLTDYLDGVLPPELRHKLETHVVGCDGCTEYIRQIRATVCALEAADLQLVPRAPVPDD